MRNRDFNLMLLCMGFFSIAATAAGFLLGGAVAGCLVLGVCLIFLLVFVLSHLYRYRQMRELSGYLRRIRDGEYTLDIRDNAEGEMSILKNEVHNLTVVLSRQAEQLGKDRLYLADALSDISHQLKTPLTSMLVMTDLLNGELPAEKRAEFTQTIRSQLERIEWLVTALLKLSKLDAGTIPFKQEKVSLKEVVRRAAEPLLIPIELRGQTLQISGEETAVFVGDLQWTAEAVVNVLKNCSEHTPQGGSISVTYEDNPLYAAIVISDSGEGIHREDLPYIFNRFYKGKNAGSDSVGIGLAMSRSILLRQNGDITVRSTPGQGSEFTIKIMKCVV